MNDQWHKSEYERAAENAREFMPPQWQPPTWEQLTDEQKQNIREANLENQKYMADLGEAIRTGGPYPDVPK